MTWHCSSCGWRGTDDDTVGFGRCPHCGHELDEDSDTDTDAAH